jgi:hypothetical protein
MSGWSFSAPCTRLHIVSRLHVQRLGLTLPSLQIERPAKLLRLLAMSGWSFSAPQGIKRKLCSFYSCSSSLLNPPPPPHTPYAHTLPLRVLLTLYPQVSTPRARFICP